MDILDNVATELGFEFHLYIVRDELFGSKSRRFKDWLHNNNDFNHHQAGTSISSRKNYENKSQTHDRSVGGDDDGEYTYDGIRVVR